MVILIKKPEEGEEVKNPYSDYEAYGYGYESHISKKGDPSALCGASIFGLVGRALLFVPSIACKGCRTILSKGE